MEAAQPSGRVEGSSPAPVMGRGQSPAVVSTTRGRAGGVGSQGTSTGGVPGQVTRGGSAASNGGSMEDSRFECNICLDQVNEPVVTLCGHLFCWPCLFRWLNSNHNICPVCKAGVTKDNVIPLYGRGTEQVDPRTKPRDHDDVPTRPAAQRPEARPQVHPHGFMGGMPFGTTGFSNTHYAAHGMSFSAGFGFFPSLFGLQFQTFSPPTPSHTGSTTTMTTEEAQQAFLSRLLLLLGIFVVMCLLMF